METGANNEMDTVETSTVCMAYAPAQIALAFLTVEGVSVRDCSVSYVAQQFHTMQDEDGSYDPVSAALSACRAGDVEILERGAGGGPGSLNMFMQVSSGAQAGVYNDVDSLWDRVRYFSQCLARIKDAFDAGRVFTCGFLESLYVQLHLLSSACLHHVFAGELGDCANGIAFPWECGRGIGGQGWPQYAAILSDFAARMPFKTLVVRVPTDDENSNKQYLDS